MRKTRAGEGTRRIEGFNEGLERVKQREKDLKGEIFNEKLRKSGTKRCHNFIRGREGISVSRTGRGKGGGKEVRF